MLSAKEAASQTLQAKQTIIDKNLAALPNLIYFLKLRSRLSKVSQAIACA